MNTTREDIPREDEMVDQALRASLGGEAPSSVRTRLEGAFGEAQARLGERRRPLGGRSFLGINAFRLAWAGAGAGCGSVGVLLILLLVAPPSPSWADVVERFRSVTSLSCTVFVGGSYFRPVERIELWKSSNGSSRVHHRGRVVFGRDGKVLKAFDTDSRQPIDVASLDRTRREDPILFMMINMAREVGSMQEFSLGALLRPKGDETVTRHPLNSPAVDIASDLEVFDLTSEQTPEWGRVWVLRNTRLPVRVLNWDPGDEDFVEALFDYSVEQPDEAFDPEAFQAAITKLDERADRVYALLRDAGGRPRTPKDLEEGRDSRKPTTR